MRNLILIISILLVGCSKNPNVPNTIERVYSEESCYTLVKKLNDNNNYSLLMHSSFNSSTNRWQWFTVDANTFVEFELGKIYFVISDYNNKIISFKNVGEVDLKKISHQFGS